MTMKKNKGNIKNQKLGLEITRSNHLNQLNRSKKEMDKVDHYPGLFLKAKDGFPLQKLKPAFFSESKHIFAGSGKDIKIYSATSGSWIQTLRGHDHEVRNICQIEDSGSESVVTCDKSGSVIFWNDRSKKKIHLPEGKRIQYFELMPKMGCIVGYSEEKNPLQEIVFYRNFKKKPQVLFRNVNIGINKVSVNRRKILLAAIIDKTLLYSYFPFSDKGSHVTRHQLTCVQCHPSEDMIAVGNELGQITLFYEVYKKWPFTKILHWHTLPVMDFCFSFTGSQLISGGSECVCIQWDLKDGTKHKLPRLGMPIVSVTLDEENDYIILTHNDNGMSLMNAKSFSLEGIIAGLTRHVPEVVGKYELILPTGVHIHPASKQLVLNGKIGHLQFYDIHKDKLICHFDITQTNFISNERHMKVANPDITHMDISSDGRWMVTCESCTVSSSLTDVKMKFWEFSEENQCWSLNTRITKPHAGSITSVCFSPVLEEESLRCISCGTDGKFNVWLLHNADKTLSKESKEHWYCFLSEQYLDLTPSCCTFSPDGSMFVVAFGCILTLWQSSSFKFLGTLSQSYLKNDIRFVQFNEGSHAGCFLISCSMNWVSCWDVLSTKLLWRIKHSVSCIASNPLSGMIAIFTEDKEAYLFHPSRCKPVAALNSFSDNIMIATKFVPSLDRAKSTTETPWLSNHTLVCIDSDQVLFTVGGESIASPSDKKVDKLNKLTKDLQWSTGATPFAALVSESQEKVKMKLKQDISNKELSYTSPDTLVKAFADVQSFNFHSFSSIIKEMSGIVSPPPVSTISNITSVPEYVTLDDEDETKDEEDRDDVKVSRKCINHIKYNNLTASIRFGS